MLSGSSLCDELITRPGESYRLWCVVVCDLATLLMRRSWPALDRSANSKNELDICNSQLNFIFAKKVKSVLCGDYVKICKK